MRFTIEEYAKAYSISPEMVHSRLRRNRLNYILENDETYIVVPKHQVPHHVADDSSEKKQEPFNEDTSTRVIEKKTTVATVIGLYQKENHYLKVKIEELEAKVDKLITEKELLLKDERIRLEKVYNDKDAQLKSILELLNTKLLQTNTSEVSIDSHVIEENIPEPLSQKQEENTKSSAPVELKQYLRSLNLKSATRKSIKRRFAEAFGADARILLNNGLFYLDFDRYDYSDLLKLK